MAKRKKKKSYGYAIFIILYVVLVLGAAYMVLSKLWILAEEYENSRPTNVIDKYIDELSVNLESTLAATLSSMEHPMQTDEECVQIAKELLGSGISYKRQRSTNAGRSITYSLVCQNGTFGKVEIHKDESLLPKDLVTFDMLAWFTEEELTPWALGEEEFYFEGLYSSIQVTVPKTYQVTLNGRPLGSEYIIEDDIHYDVLENYYGTYSGLPVKVTYSFDKIIGNMEPVIYDDMGNEFVIDSSMDDSQFITSCSEADSARLREFCDAFLVDYVGYTSGKYKNSTEYGYVRLKDRVKPGSDMDTRMVAAQDGIQYTHAPATVSATRLNDAIRLTDGVYLCSVGYDANSQTPRGYEEVSVDMKLIIEENEGTLLVVKEDR